VVAVRPDLVALDTARVSGDRCRPGMGGEGGRAAVGVQRAGVGDELGGEDGAQAGQARALPEALREMARDAGLS
jgi:hypothetical protein